MKYLRAALWILLAAGLMGQATPTATPTPTAPLSCAVTGVVVNPDGSPFVGTINFNSKSIQVINSYPVYPTIVNTVTDASGNIAAVSLPQGLVMSVTMCPSKAQAAGCAAPFSAIVPFASTATMGQMAQGIGLTGATTANLTTLNVTNSFIYGSAPNAVLSLSPPSTPPYNGLLSLVLPAPNFPSVPAANLLVMTSNGNWASAISLTNNVAGPKAYTAYYLYDDVAGEYGALYLTNSTYVGTGPYTPNTLILGDNTSGGLNLTTNLATEAIGFWNAGVEQAHILHDGLHIDSGNLWMAGRTVGYFASGAWTPQLQFGGANAGMVCNNCYGLWTWSGQNVTLEFVINLGSKGSSTGAATVTGFPSNMGANTVANSYGVCVNVGGLVIAAGYIPLPQMAGGANPYIMLEAQNPGANSFVSLNDGNFASGAFGGNLQCTISYMSQL